MADSDLPAAISASSLWRISPLIGTKKVGNEATGFHSLTFRRSNWKNKQIKKNAAANIKVSASILWSSKFKHIKRSIFLFKSSTNVWNQQQKYLMIWTHRLRHYSTIHAKLKKRKGCFWKIWSFFFSLKKYNLKPIRFSGTIGTFSGFWRSQTGVEHSLRGELGPVR